MPVVQVFVPPADDVPSKLGRVCVVLSEALGLAPADVVATHVPVLATVRPGDDPGHDPGQDGAVWPVVVVHSSPRPEEAVRRGVAALTELADSWTDTGGAWVSWQERT